MDTEEDTVRKMGHAKDMRAFLSHLEPEAINAMPHPHVGMSNQPIAKSHSGATLGGDPQGGSLVLPCAPLTHFSLTRGLCLWGRYTAHSSQFQRP